MKTLTKKQAEKIIKDSSAPKGYLVSLDSDGKTEWQEPNSGLMTDEEIVEMDVPATYIEYEVQYIPKRVIVVPDRNALVNITKEFK